MLPLILIGSAPFPTYIPRCWVFRLQLVSQKVVKELPVHQNFVSMWGVKLCVFSEPLGISKTSNLESPNVAGLQFILLKFILKIFFWSFSSKKSEERKGVSLDFILCVQVSSSGNFDAYNFLHRQCIEPTSAVSKFVKE